MTAKPDAREADMAKAGPQGSGSRNGLVEWSRLVCALGIVWFHTKAPGGYWGHIGLQVFVILLIHFSLGLADRDSVGRFMRRRAGRLLVPWLVWSLIYAAAKTADAVMQGAPLSSEFRGWMLFTGPSIHLWFLPFAFLLALGLALLPRSGRGRAWLWPASLAALALAPPLSSMALEAHPPTPLPQIVYVAPAAALGLCLHLADGRPGRLGMLLGMLALALLAAWSWDHDAAYEIQIGVGGMIGLAIVANHLPSTRVSAMASALSLNVYLAHPLIAAALSRLGELPPLAMGLTVCALSLMLAYAIASLAPQRLRFA